MVKGALDDFDEDDELTYEDFSAAIKKNTRLEHVLRDQLVIPNFDEFAAVIEQIYHETKGIDAGNVATYIPQLARVDPELYGISVCTVDGQRFEIGDTRVPYSAQSTSKPITYAIACELRGEETVHQHVGREPSGRNFNELVLNSDGLPHNPLVNSGAIMCASLIKPECSMAERYEYAIEIWTKLTGGQRPSFGNSIYLSERATADTNFCLGYMMKEKGAFEKDCNLLHALELYFMFCSIEVTAEQTATVAATLANAGICPLTEQPVFQPRTVRNCLSMMGSCGMYDFSGEFAFKMGFPAKSGVSGGLMIVIPGLMGISVFSPRLDRLGNTVRGIKFCEALAARFKFHSFDNLVGLSDPGKIDPRREKEAELTEDFVSFWWAASRGDLYRLRQLIARGVSPDCVDYDRRTALHLAAGNGHLNIVQYLCFCGCAPAPKDRFGGTPLDEALRNSHAAVASFLREFVAPSSDVLPFVPLFPLDAHHAQNDAATTGAPAGNNNSPAKTPSSPAGQQTPPAASSDSSTPAPGTAPASFPEPHPATGGGGGRTRSPSIDPPTNLKDKLGNMHQYFLSVNTTLSTRTGKGGLRKLLKDSGINPDDPRLSALHSLPPVFAEEQFVPAAENTEFLRKILEGRLSVPNFPAFAGQMDVFFERLAPTRGGEVSNRLPNFSSVSPTLFGVAICTLDGQRYARGDTKVRFPVSNISKVVSYALALEEHGQDVHRFVGCEPSGRNSSDLILNSDGLPHNPLLDSGGIMCASLIRRDLDTPDRFEVVLDAWTRACGHTRPSFANANFLCERDFADRNYSLGHLMKAKRLFPPQTEIDQIIALYCMLNSIELTTEGLSVFAGTLANGGVCPLTGQRIFKPSTVRSVLSLMSSCGMYEYSGEWAFTIGVPAKCSSSGALLIVIPNVMGIATYSPPLDRYGISVRGLELCHLITTTYAFHTYDKVVRAHRQDPRLYQGSHEESQIAQLCYAASAGDINEIRRVLSHGVNVSGADYDGRTALHMAVAENQAKAAQFLVLCGADLARQDAWGHTPVDEAERLGMRDMVKTLEKAAKMKGQVVLERFSSLTFSLLS